MGLGCTADFQTINHPNCSFSFSLLSKMGDCRQSGMSSSWNRCDVLSFKQRSHRSLRNAKIRGFVIPEVWLPIKGFWRFLKPISGLCRGLHTGKAIRTHLYGCFSDLWGTGLARVPCFYSIGKLTTRFDFHRTQNWPHKSASRGHGIWHRNAAHMVGHEWTAVTSEKFIKSV